MGWFDRIFGNSPQKNIEKWGLKSIDKMAQSADRMEALFWLNEEGSQESLLRLFRRFSFKHDKTIDDEEEKSWVYNALVEKGEDVLVPLEQYLLETDSLSWPLRILAQVATPQKRAQILEQICKQNPNEYTRDTTKKVQLLSWLGEHPSKENIDLLVPYLSDPSEEVRFTAVHALFLQQSSDGWVNNILELLVSKEEESRRIKLFIVEEFYKRQIPIPIEKVKQVHDILVRYAKNASFDSLGRIKLVE